MVERVAHRATGTAAGEEPGGQAGSVTPGVERVRVLREVQAKVGRRGRKEGNRTTGGRERGRGGARTGRRRGGRLAWGARIRGASGVGVGGGGGGGSGGSTGVASNVREVVQWHVERGSTRGGERGWQRGREGVRLEEIFLVEKEINGSSGWRVESERLTPLIEDSER